LEVCKFRFWKKDMTTLKMRDKGTITFPAKMLKKYKLQDGDVFTVIELGGGSLLLTPKILEVDIISKRIAKQLKEDDVNLEDLLQTLREVRPQLVREKYGDLKKTK
jgi:bifunctional DNA-binding transcriptional regulator/antitoxin component of YhaV-PrlF toxin-antitoxin module